jgi:hypothetical protein
MGPRVVLDAVVKRKIPRPRRELNPRTPIVQPVAQRYLNYVKHFSMICYIINFCRVWFRIIFMHIAVLVYIFNYESVSLRARNGSSA